MLAFSWANSTVLDMHVRITLLLLCAGVLSSCSEYYEDTSSQPKLRQEARTTATGQTVYDYRPDDAPANH